MKRLAYRFVLSPARTAYWRLFRPRTHGVHVVIEDERSGNVLLVRHCYGDRSVWHLPGGGYRPHRESPEEAGRREVLEELSVEPGPLTWLGEYRTSQYGNRDMIQLLHATVRDAEPRPGAEIEEHRWASRRTIRECMRITGVTQHALALLEGRRGQSAGGASNRPAPE